MSDGQKVQSHGQEAPSGQPRFALQQKSEACSEAQPEEEAHLCSRTRPVRARQAFDARVAHGQQEETTPADCKLTSISPSHKASQEELIVVLL